MLCLINIMMHWFIKNPNCLERHNNGKITQGFSYCVTQDKFDCEDLIQWYENLNHENIKRLCASKLNKVKDDMDIFTKRVEKFLQV